MDLLLFFLPGLALLSAGLLLRWVGRRPRTRTHVTTSRCEACGTVRGSVSSASSR